MPPSESQDERGLGGSRSGRKTSGSGIVAGPAILSEGNTDRLESVEDGGHEITPARKEVFAWTGLIRPGASP